MVFHNPLFRDMSIEEPTLEQPTSPSRMLCGMLCMSPRTTKECGADPGSSSNEDQNDHPPEHVSHDAPLHCAVERFALDCLGSPLDRTLLEENITALLDDDPESVHQFNSRGMLPLHIACREGASLAVIQALVRVWPESVQCPTHNKQQMLPLHLVCRYHAGRASERMRVLRYLLEAYATAAQVANGPGNLALHLALQNYFCTLPVVQLLVQTYPESVRTVNDQHRLPLHIACGHQYMKRVTKKCSSKTKTRTSDRDDRENSCRSSDVIQYLLQQYPAGAQVLDRAGTLPLHAAIQGYQTPSTIRLLLEACPEAIAHADGSGRTALHLAVSRAAPHLETVKLLLTEHPAAAEKVDDKNKLPIHYAESNNHAKLNLLSIFATSAAAAAVTLPDDHRDVC